MFVASTEMSRPSAAEMRQLADLLEVSTTLGSSLDLRASLVRALEPLQEHHGAVTAIVALNDGGGSSELTVRASLGLSAQVARRVNYKAGEGITGRVFQSGKPVIVPQVSREPLYLDLTRVVEKVAAARAELHLRPHQDQDEDRRNARRHAALLKDRDYDRESKFLGVVASMIGQAVRIQQLIESERQRLLAENTSFARSSRSATTCATSSAAAGRCSPSTSRWRRWPPRRPRS